MKNDGNYDIAKKSVGGMIYKDITKNILFIHV